jgi:4-amino-4-deoxy-L-arabinose transferase-like glycosyltransferase
VTERGATTRTSWLGRAARRVPGVVWALTGLQVALGLMCTVLYPPFTGYDESWHTDMVWAFYHADGLYGPGERIRDRGVEAATELVPIPVPRVPYAQAPVPDRGARKSIDAMDDGNPVDYPQPNQMTQHPPLYYAVEAGLLHLVPGSGSLPYDRQVWLLRLFSLLLVVPLPLLCWAAANRLTGQPRVGVIAAAVPVAIPGLARLAGSVNNDNLLTLLSAVLLYLLVRVVTGDLSVRTGGLVGAVTALALLAKGFALVLPLVVGVAYVVAWLRERRVVWRPLLAAVLLTALGAWWWVRNEVLYGTVQPSGVGPVWSKIIAGPARPGGRPEAFVHGFFHGFLLRLWSEIGLPDRPNLPPWMNYGWLVLVLVGAVAAVLFGLRGERWSRAAGLMLAMPLVLTTGVVFAGALGAYLYNQRYAGIQGRYVYGAILGMATLAAWGWTRLAGRASRYLPPVLVAAGLGTQAYAWVLLLDAWWAPRSGGSRLGRLHVALGGVVRWSPWPKPVTELLLGLAVVAGLVAFAASLRYALRQADESPATNGPQAAEAVTLAGGWQPGSL